MIRLFHFGRRCIIILLRRVLQVEAKTAPWFGRPTTCLLPCSCSSGAPTPPKHYYSNLDTYTCTKCRRRRTWGHLLEYHQRINGWGE